MDIFSIKKVGSSKSSKRMLALSLQDIKELCRIPDESLKVSLALMYKKTMKDEDVSQVTGKTIEEVHHVRGGPLSKNDTPDKDRGKIKKEEEVFVPSAKLEQMGKSKDVWQQILAMYWIIKELSITDKKGYKMLYSPYNIKLAKELEIFDADTVKRAMYKAKHYASSKGWDWDLRNVIVVANKISNT